MLWQIVGNLSGKFGYMNMEDFVLKELFGTHEVKGNYFIGCIQGFVDCLLKVVSIAFHFRGVTAEHNLDSV